MAVFPIPHHHWQILRAVKRSRKAPTGRELRLSPTRNTKDGTFLNGLVVSGLLTRVTGTDKEPFLATYALTELGIHAAEYGECDFPSTPPTTTPPSKRAK